jgi:PhnB protein
MAKAIPEGYHTITPYLTVRGATDAIAFYTRAFGAKEKERMTGPDGRSVMHAELTIGDSVFMLSDEMPQAGTASPTTLKGSTAALFLYVPDVDAAFKRATDEGCKVVRPLADMFWGDRFGQVEDPFGHRWGLATHKEDVSPEEMKRRSDAFMASMAKGQKQDARDA